MSFTWLFGWTPKENEHQAILNALENEKEGDSLIRDSQSLLDSISPARSSAFSSAALHRWILATFTLAMLLFLVLGLLLREVVLHSHGTFAHGYTTEFALALPAAIKVKQTKFDGNLVYTPSRVLYLDLERDMPRYVGKPSDEVDRAWEALILPPAEQVVELTKKEAKRIDKQAYGTERRGYRAGPDVLHTLHCLNFIRQIIDSEYYFNSSVRELTRAHRLHTDHCINHVRQSVLCHLDLTPFSNHLQPQVKTVVSDFHVMHTCRDMKTLHEWMATMARREPAIDRVAEGLKGVGKGVTEGYVPGKWGLEDWDFEEPEE